MAAAINGGILKLSQAGPGFATEKSGAERSKPVRRCFWKSLACVLRGVFRFASHTQRGMAGQEACPTILRLRFGLVCLVLVFGAVLFFFDLDVLEGLAADGELLDGGGDARAERFEDAKEAFIDELEG